MRKAFIAAAAAAGVLTGAGVATADVPAEDRVLQPDGYKTLLLGQSEADAEATGLLVGRTDAPTCHFYNLPPEEGKPNVGGGVFVDPALGVIAITGTDLIHTPENITMGSSFDEVQAAYPALANKPPQDFVYTTPVPGASPEEGPLYRFAFDEANKVADFAVESTAPNGCIS